MSTSTINPNNIDPLDDGIDFGAAVKAEFVNAAADLTFQTTIEVGTGHTLTGSFGSITGGQNNSITVGGLSHIGGGSSNSITQASGFIGGGFQNSISGLYSAISGGWINTVAGDYSSILCGFENTVNGDYSSIVGGRNNFIKERYSIAGGRNVSTGFDGEWAFSDSSSFDWDNTIDTTHTWAANQANLRYIGGFYFCTGVDGSGVPTSGGQLVSGSNAWATLSDKNKKTNFKKLDHFETVDKIRNIDVPQWQYKSDSETDKNYFGWMAQDFHKSFNFGSEVDKLSIDTQQNIGVLTSAVKGLIEHIDLLNKRIEKLESN